MTDRIRSFFESQISPDAPPIYTDRLQEERRRLDAAACALLLELAYADDDFSAAERDHVEELIREQFGLNVDGARELLSLCESERSGSADLRQMTQLIREKYDPSQKSQLVEALWGLALSDGRIAQHEASMLGKIAELLELNPEDMDQARKRVESRGATPR